MTSGHLKEYKAVKNTSKHSSGNFEKEREECKGEFKETRALYCCQLLES